MKFSSVLRMTTFRHLVLGATISSGVAIIGSLLVAFSLVSEINKFRDDVLSDLSHFKVLCLTNVSKEV